MRRIILLRDYLRSQPAAREAYAVLKIGLARRFRDDRDAYTDAKSEFIEDALRRAARTGHAG